MGRVGDEAHGIVDIPDMDFLILNNIHRVQQDFFDRAGSIVVLLAVGYCTAVALGSE